MHGIGRSALCGRLIILKSKLLSWSSLPLLPPVETEAPVKVPVLFDMEPAVAWLELESALEGNVAWQWRLADLSTTNPPLLMEMHVLSLDPNSTSLFVWWRNNSCKELWWCVYWTR
jgi:hypothetical protein